MQKSSLSNEVIAVVPAAGSGTRYGPGTRKPFLLLNGKPLIIWALEILESVPNISHIIPVLKKSDLNKGKKLFQQYEISKILRIVEGGKERQDSVLNALTGLKGNFSIVMIHDGARPFLTKDMIERGLDELDGFDGVVVGMPPKDTIKETEHGFVQSTLNRDSLWAIQTPQFFPVQVISAAYERAYRERYYSTDDAALVERYGGRVKVIKGSYSNIKITTPEDLAFAELLLSQRLIQHKKERRKKTNIFI